MSTDQWRRALRMADWVLPFGLFILGNYTINFWAGLAMAGVYGAANLLGYREGMLAERHITDEVMDEHFARCRGTDPEKDNRR